MPQASDPTSELAALETRLYRDLLRHGYLVGKPAAQFRHPSEAEVEFGSGRLYEELWKMLPEPTERLSSSAGFSMFDTDEALVSMVGQRIHNVIKLRSFAVLEHGWNGYGALPLDGDLIDECVQLLYTPGLLGLQPDVFPTGRGSIQFEYENEDGQYLEIEIYSDGRKAVYASFADEGTMDEDDMPWPEIVKLIQKFDA